MATYAVGDIQGCLKPLESLLARVRFDPATDTLWSTGDLINRGPENLATLRWFYANRDSIVLTLGNHDLHLLAVSEGVAKAGRSDNFDDILAAPDRQRLLDWLRHQPLLHRSSLSSATDATQFTLVHAGIPPIWSTAEALNYAREVESVLRGPDYRRFLRAMYGNEPYVWSPHLRGLSRWRVITNYLTRMRYCTRRGKLDFVSKDATPRQGILSGKTVKGWYAQPHRLAANERIVFGHWASLAGKTGDQQFIGLDTGCVWGGCMTLINLDSGERHTCDC